MASETWILRASALLLLVASLSALPPPELTTDADIEELPTLATELKPPAPPSGKSDEHRYMVFVINLYGVKNATGETSEEMFDNNLVEKVPDILEPLATVLLVVEDEGDEESSSPVDLDEVAKDLEKEGFTVEKINHAGETKVVRVKIDNDDVDSVIESSSKPKPERLTVRKRRTACLKCLSKGYGGGGGGGYHQPSHPQPVQRPQPVYSQPSCDPCQGRGNGGHGGGGSANAYAEAHASASAYGK